MRVQGQLGAFRRPRKRADPSQPTWVRWRSVAAIIFGAVCIVLGIRPLWTGLGVRTFSHLGSEPALISGPAFAIVLGLTLIVVGILGLRANAARAGGD